MKASIVIPTRHRATKLALCLESLESQVNGVDVEIIVVQDGKQDETDLVLAYWKKRIPQLVVIRSPACHGAGWARNQGILVSKGEFILFLDDDCIANQNWVGNFVRVFETNPSVQVIAGGILPVPEKSSYIGQWKYNHYVQSFSQRNSEFGTTVETKGHVIFSGGANKGYRRSALEMHGLFNESLRVYEDTELDWRLGKNGVYALYVPGLVVLHHFDISLWHHIKQSFNAGRGRRLFQHIHPDIPFYPPHVSLTRLLLNDLFSINYHRSLLKSQQGSSSPGPGLYLYYAVIFSRIAFLAGHISTSREDIERQMEEPGDELSSGPKPHHTTFMHIPNMEIIEAIVNRRHM